MTKDGAMVERFHDEMIDLIKKYQFRDRNEMAGCGMSVSQCYIIETLHRYGPLPMQKLADKMHLSISTVTRVVEPLVKEKLVAREESPTDRRVRVMSLTEKGNERFFASWKGILESEKSILESFPPESREMLVTFMSKLNVAFGNWKPKFRSNK